MNETKRSLRQRFTSLMKQYCGQATKPGAFEFEYPEEFDALCDMVRNETAPPRDERKFLVTSRYGWATDTNLIGAKKKCRQETPRGAKNVEYRASLIHRDCRIDNMTIEYPLGYAFRLDLGEI